VRHFWFVAALFWSLTCSLTRADDVLAREQFEIGVAAADENRWSDAVAHLEASIAQSDRAATRYNLVLAHDRLGHSLEVVHHGLAFLAKPDEVERTEARVKVQELVAQAKSQLAALDTEALASGTVLFVDGGPPLAREQSQVFVLAGAHRIEVRAPGRAPDVSEQSLVAGQVLRLLPPAALLPPPAPDRVSERTITRAELSEHVRKPTRDDPVSSLPRQRAAWALASVGAAAFVAGVACLGLSYARANRLRSGGVEGTELSGYLDASGRYQRSLNTVIPLAFASAGLMSVAVGLGEKVVRRRNLTFMVVSLVAASVLFGAGAFLLARDPGAVVAMTGLDMPSRQLGGLLFAAGLPLATYVVGLAIRNDRRHARAQVSLSGARVAW
jgi:hypothetical protein